MTIYMRASNAGIQIFGNRNRRASLHSKPPTFSYSPGSAKWYLWHGSVHQSLKRIDTLIERIEHDERVAQGPERRKLARTLNELYGYLESIATSFPTMGIVVDPAKRFQRRSPNTPSIK